MKKQHYSIHQASFIKINANILCLSLYLTCGMISLYFLNYEFLAILIPLLIFFMEKKSKFIKFHALQISFVHGILFLINLIFNIVALLFINMYTPDVNSTMQILSATLYALSIILTGLSIIVLIIDCIGIAQSYKWNTFQIPFLGKTISIAVKEDQK